MDKYIEKFMSMSIHWKLFFSGSGALVAAVWIQFSAVDALCLAGLLLVLASLVSAIGSDL